jgi:two-component system sensor histidine kinase AlgZ
MGQPRDFWVRLVAICAAASLAAAVVVNALMPAFSWRNVGETVLGSFVVSMVISSLASVVLSYLAPILFHRFGPWLRWSILIVVLIALAAVGSLIAVTAILIVGILPARWDAFIRTYQNTLATALVITLIVGIFATLNDALQWRLDAATLALRTKERDEAEARRLAAEAQRASLEARVNPHFFFNTLNSIAALTREDPAGAERMTTQLASLMRSSLDHESAPLVPLEQEERLVRDYLEIEGTRFGERLRYAVEITDAAKCALVPRLSLQTLVENSVKYAVSPRREGASLCVRARMADGRVKVEVVDDGAGFDATMIPEGHGLALLRSRLAMNFGADAALSVDSRPGRTAVSFDLPVRVSAD